MGQLDDSQLGQTIREYQDKCKQFDEIIALLREVRISFAFVQPHRNEEIDVVNCGTNARNAMQRIMSLGDGDVLMCSLEKLNNCSKERQELARTLKQSGHGNLLNWPD